MTIGYIFANIKFFPEDKIFFNLAKEKNIKIILFPSARVLPEITIKKLAKKCDVVINNSAESEAYEIAKIIEMAGIPVVDPTSSLYYFENKWLFYILCKNNGIPTPHTVLLPKILRNCYQPIKRILRKNGAVIIKNIMSDNGQFVDRAKTLPAAIACIKKFHKGDRAPLIAQEYIKQSHKVYRTLVIGNKVVQGAIKSSKHWKCTGRFIKGDCKKFYVTPKLAHLSVKIARLTKIPWCGIDFMRKNNEWIAIEANSSPGMDFIENDIPIVYKYLLNYLITMYEKWWKI